jgi:hypothetical protein
LSFVICHPQEPKATAKSRLQNCSQCCQYFSGDII